MILSLLAMATMAASTATVKFAAMGVTSAVAVYTASSKAKTYQRKPVKKQ